MNLDYINKIAIIIIHIILTLFLIYLALNIIHKKSISSDMGYVLISMIIFIIIFHIYDLLYKNSLKKEKDQEKPQTSQGILTRKRDDPGYDIIGGIGGFG